MCAPEMKKGAPVLTSGHAATFEDAKTQFRHLFDDDHFSKDDLERPRAAQEAREVLHAASAGNHTK